MSKYLKHPLLKSKSNIIGKYVMAANRLVKKIKDYPGIVGIIVSGGVSRGYADHYSEVDLFIYLDRKTYNRWIVDNKSPLPCGSLTYQNIPFHVCYEGYEAELLSDWGDSKIWDRGNAIVLYDPRRRVSELISSKTKISASDIKDKIRDRLYDAWWYNFLSKIWILRGDNHSAQYIINESIAELLKVIFLLNGQFYPHPKWLLYYAKYLKWRPANFSLIEKLLEIKSFDKSAIEERSNQLRLVTKECIGYYLRNQYKYAYPIFWSHAEWINILLSIYFNPGLTRHSLGKIGMNYQEISLDPLYRIIINKRGRYYVNRAKLSEAAAGECEGMMDLYQKELSFIFKKINNPILSKRLRRHFVIH